MLLGAHLIEFGKAAASDVVRSLESGLPSSERNKRWIVILQAFIDDSGTQGPQPFFSLGGFISTADRWARFSDEWKTELDREPSIPYFKMTEAFFPKKGPFKGWKQRAIERRVCEFVKIIQKHAMLRVSCSMRRDDYRELFGDRFFRAGSALRKINHPYFFCFWALIHGIIDFQRQNGWDTSIDFIFDEQGGMGTETVRWHPIFKKTAPPHLQSYFGSPPIFRDDKEFLPLQAADLYAWSIRRHARENKILFMPLREELKALASMRGMDRMMDGTYLGALVQHISEHGNAPLPKELLALWLAGSKGRWGNEPREKAKTL